MGTIRLVVLAAAAWHAAAQVKGSASRCRNKELECDSWSKRGECEKNYDFMADRCPVACGYCANAGLLPTPAVFELEYACDGQLKERPQKWDLAWRNEGGGEVFSPEGTARMLPDGCAFRCRDRLPGCAAAAAQGQCTSLPEVLRKQCPASCGVCAALSLKECDGRDWPRFAENGRDWQRFLGGGQRRLRTAGVRLRWQRQQARTRGGARA